MRVSDLLIFETPLKWAGRASIALILSFGWVDNAVAQMWTDYATVSATAGLAANRLCYSDGRDLACDATAPYLTPTGRVGIGLTVPSFPLDVAGGAQVRGAAAAGAAFAIQPDAVSGANGVILESGFATGGYGPTIFKNGGVESMRIASNGNVGIGTNSPGGYALSISASAMPYSNVGIGIGSKGDTALEIGEAATGNHYAFIDLTGDSTYADYGLRIIRNNDGPNAANLIQARGTGGLHLQTQDAAPILLYTNNTERMRTDASGNVGIGTSSPGVLLDVSGTIRSNVSADTSASIRVRQSGYRQYGWQIPASSYDLTLYDYDAPAERMRITSAGNVGIGTSAPAYALHISSTTNSDRVIAVDSSGNVARLLLTNTGTNGRSWSISAYKNTIQPFGGLGIADETSPGSPQRLVIDGNGNVGINTYAPNAKLEVNGTISATNLVLSGGCTGCGGGGSPGTPTTAVQYNDNGALAGGGVYYISSSGNVGVGTGTPGETLHISGTAMISRKIPYLYISDTNSTGKLVLAVSNGGNFSDFSGLGDAVVRTGANASGDGANLILTTRTVSGNILFGTGLPDTEKMRISSNGRIGVGVANPQFVLDVSGSIRGKSTSSTPYGLVVTNANGAAGAFVSDFVMGGSASDFYMGNYQSVPLRFIVSNTEAMRIAANGNIGIGTNGPTYALSIVSTGAPLGIFYGSGSALSYLDVQSDNANSSSGAIMRLITKNVAGNGVTSVDLVKYKNGTFNILNNETDPAAAMNFGIGGSTRLSINSSGNVGIGTSAPTQPLDVRSLIRIANTDFVPSSGGSFLDLSLGTSSGSTYSKLQAFTGGGASSGVLALNPVAGNVGIGTASPNAKLEVNGAISATNLVLSGSCTGCGGGSAGIATYALPNVNATPSWIKLGTFTAAQTGQHLTIKVVTSAGYNADPTQQTEVNIHFKTSNGSSVDANGFAGESTFYITNGTGGMTAYNVKVKSNAAGNSAASYDVYFYQPYSYNGSGAFYTVEYPSTATWANSAATGADPGVASSTVGVGTQRQILLSNVGIGQSPGAGVQLDVSGSLRANGGVVTAQSGSNYSQLTSNQLYTGSQPLYLNNSNNQNVLLFAGGTGNLGIGEGSPSERLSIGGNPSLFLQGNSSNWGYKLNVTDYGGGNVPLRFIRRNAGTDTEMLRLNQTGDLIFSATNPTLSSGGSYFYIPNGAYFSGGTVYVANNANFRGGIANDAGAYLQVNGGTSSYTYLPGRLGVGSGMTAPAYPLDINGNMRASGEIIGTSSNQVRMIGGNYGAFFRNDGSNLYLLLTASADQYGGWNTLRPLTVNVATGAVSIGNGLSLTGDLAMNNYNVTNATYYTTRAADGSGLAFWNDPTNFRIFMSAQGTAGAGRLDSTSDYNMYFRMSGGTNRGFVFQTGTTNIAQIDGAGNVYATSYLHTSDRNLKTNIAPVNDAVGLLTGINGVHFNWKKDGTPAYGVIAQDVQKVMPEAVKSGGPSGTLVVDYDQLIAPLIEAAKLQQKQIGAQQKRIDDLEGQVRKLQRVLH